MSKRQILFTTLISILSGWLGRNMRLNIFGLKIIGNPIIVGVITFFVLVWICLQYNKESTGK
jgi:hypothetical protein